MLRNASIAGLCLAVVVSFPGLGDTVELRDGRSLSGRLKADAYAITTAAEGKIVVPLQAILRVDFEAGGEVVIELSDGRKLSGTWSDGEVLLERDLFSNSFAPDAIRSLLVSPRADVVNLPSGSRVRIMLAEWLNSKQVKPGQELHFCVAEDLNLGGRTVLPRGTPARGKVAAAQAAAKGSQQGELAIEAGSLTAPDGKVLSLRGSDAFEGGLNAANFVAFGVLGFAAAGEDVLVPAGVELEAITTTGESLELVPLPTAGEAWQRCHEFFRFAGGEVPLEQHDAQAAYAPFARSFTVSIAVAQLRTGAPQRWRLGNLMTHDTYLPNATVEVIMRKKLTEVRLSVQLAVLPSRDKLVDLRAALVNGTSRVATGDRLNIDAEEEKTTSAALAIKLPTETWTRLQQTADARLKVELTVK